MARDAERERERDCSELRGVGEGRRREEEKREERDIFGDWLSVC